MVPEFLLSVSFSWLLVTVLVLFFDDFYDLPVVNT